MLEHKIVTDRGMLELESNTSQVPPKTQIPLERGIMVKTHFKQSQNIHIRGYSLYHDLQLQNI